jgi:DtxR family Mn-dependent transcriptional regulator
MPTPTLEEYVEAIYKLAEAGPVRPSAVASAMGVSAPTVTATLRRLASNGLVTRESGAVVLTADGIRLALSILRRHRLAERLLVDVLGLPWEDVHEEACMLEHAMSPRVQDALEAFLDEPDVCPHGHPIPSSDLSMEPTTGTPLSQAKSSESVRVVSIDERDDAAVNDAARLGLLPGTRLTVSKEGDAEGAVVVETSLGRHRIKRSTAQRIDVVSAGDDRSE